MSEYADILGYITGGSRVSSNGLDVALAVMPPTVPAGQPFQTVLLVQNTTNTHIELSATLSVPARDAAKQKGRFRASQETMSLRVRPAEVGYLILPVACHPATAVGDDYKVGVTVNTRPLTQATTLREVQDGTSGPGPMTDTRRAVVDKMRKLSFSANKRFGLRDEIEAPFRIAPANPAPATGPKAGWRSLWSLGEDGSKVQLLRQYRGLIEEHLFPRLAQKHTFEPLYAETCKRFEAAGYPLQELEATLIAKLLTFVVHMANPGEDNIDPLGGQIFNVAVHLKRDLDEDMVLPGWFEGLLRAVAEDEHIAAQPADYVCSQLYETLIHDVVPFAFAMIQKATGEDMGTAAEIHEYTENYVSRLRDGGMDFAHAYLPLVMGGVIVYDRVVLPDEKLEDTLRGMGDTLDVRDAEWDDSNDLIFLLTRELVNRSLRLFGFHI